MPSQSSRMSRSSDSTAVSGPSSSTPSMDMNTQLAPLPETRKRSRNLDLDLDSDNEESQARRVRAGNSNPIEDIESGMAIDTPARNLMAPPHSRRSRICSGRCKMSRQEQEQISSTFANIGAPSQAPAQSAPVNSPSRANHTVQASTTCQSHESTSQRHSYEETSDYDADTNGDERPSKRRRGARHNSGHTSTFPIENRNSEAVASPTSNEASVVEHQGSETASSPVSSVLLAIEAPPNQIASTRGDTPYIDLTLEDSSDEEEDDAALPPAPSVLPAVQAPSIRNIQSNANPTFVDLTFEDSSDEEESAATMSQAYIGNRIVWRSVGYEDDVEFSRQLAVLGTSGNVRDILCVHIVFILTQFLNLPAPLRHQTTFLEAELRCMMGDEMNWMAPMSTDKFCTQKSVDEQETCSICLENLEGEESIKWCRGQCGKNFHLQCIWTWANTNFQDGQPDITCGNYRAPWIWIGRQLSSFIEGMWNWQFGIRYNEAGYRPLSELLRKDVSREGYFNVAELLRIDKTVEDDAGARQSYQREVDRWRVEMVRRPTTLTEEVCAFIDRYHPEVYDDVGDEFSNESNDGNCPRAIRVLETVEIVETNVGRVLQGFPAIDSEFSRDLHLL
ncbi:hypothetical protein BCON_0033g00570 [Botryotinia convoluta]|uniref:RING-type domain-containing protein n=1 Tax=Botryotinia convoluta TaxID=54673 RepID=A0A4Z1IH89_9HELO|nr:hypothetical protein BCON_0033g00570 [Botryotinia convoluta]